MNTIEKEDKSDKNTIDIEPKIQKNKAKKKKKIIKKVKEKKCRGLKELLEQINEEKMAKTQKEKKNEKKLNLKIDKKEELSINSGISSTIENEDKNKECSTKDHINIFNNSISGTTVATLSNEESNDFQKFNYDKYSEGSNKYEYNDLMPNFLMKNFDISEENEDEQQLFKRRKFSSPICEYFDGLDKFLSETNNGTIDLINSLNFIKKEDFISSGFCMKNNHIIYNIKSNNFISSDVNNNNKDNINKFNNNIIVNEKNFDNNNNDNAKNTNNINYYNLNQLDMDINNMNDYYYMNIPYCQYINYYNTAPEENIISKFNLGYNMGNIDFCNSKKFREKNKKNKNKTKNKNNIYIRDGDWLCQHCLNVNFSFRKFCNRCKALK